METSALSKDDFSLLTKCFLFDGIRSSSIDKAVSAGGGQMKVFTGGERIGENSVGIVMEGAVKVHSPSGKHKLAMRLLSVGDMFGVAALFSDGGYVTEMHAVGHTRVLFFSQKRLERLMSEDFHIAENYIRFLSGRIRFLNRKIACLAAGSVDETLALHLLDSESGSMYVDSFSGLAEGLGVGRASLYRALDKFEAAGYISRSLHEISILDKNGLETILK